MRVSALLLLITIAQWVKCLSWNEIEEFRDNDGLIEVTEDNYQKFSKGSRAFYSILFVTASETDSQSEVCELCDLFEASVRATSRAMLAQLSEDINREAFFFRLDVKQCPSFVNEINLKSFPHMLIFPPHESDEDFSWSKSQFYQFPVTPQSASDPIHFADFLARIMNVYIQVVRDFDQTEFIQYFLVSLVCFFIFKKKILPLIPNKGWLFSLLFSLVVIYTSITGYKFTTMNNIPFLAKNEKGDVMFFSGGMGWQFGIEILTVTGMYFVMGGSVVAMIYISRVKALKPAMANATSIALLALGFYMFAYFVSCFKIKEPGYPYAIL